MDTPSRRSALKSMTGGAAGLAAVSGLSPRLLAADQAVAGLKGRVNHSVCKWCYNQIPLESGERLQVGDFPSL